MPPQPVFDPVALRRQFPLLNRHALGYFDSAATTQKPQVVLDALTQFYGNDNANVHRAAHRLSEQATVAFERARSVVARFINAPRSDEIVWTRGTTEGINLIANTLGNQLQAGDQVLLTELEHHANIVPWQLLAERRNIEIKVAPITADGDLDLECLQQLLTPKVKLVAITHVSNALGTLNPVADICRWAHAVGARVLVDGAQAVAHLPVDVQQLGCDFYAFSGHKVYGPTGIGVLWGRYQLLDSLPPWQGGGEMIEQVSFAGNRYQPPPLRFEAGTPATADAIALACALEFVASLDRTAVARHEAGLMRRATDAINAMPRLRVIGNPRQRIGALSFIAEDEHALDLGSFLDQNGFALRTGHHCCMPLMNALGLSGTARLSFACYSTTDELDRLLAALASYVDPRAAVPTQPTVSATPLTDALRTASGRDQRHSLLMKAGAEPLNQDGDLRHEANRLHGCTSQVWLRSYGPDGQGRLHFAIDSDARIIRGLIRLLLETLQDCTPAQLLQFDFERHLNQLGLAAQLSSSRTSGAKAIVTAMQAAAKQHQT
ncbi:SufS family cysteine desulfurase [Motiliproteus sediminis]|uniref:SufS family cysteine desulfurase n=1 Tax=Motiliproteus sediminis TaxID=1468178 RepID=UPI001AF003FB|nr:SufS family cysteine desulfurase [Motiliproteus sediminis]